MILKIIVFNLILTFGLLLIGEIQWGVILHVANTTIACLDHIFKEVEETDNSDTQPPDDLMTA